MAANCLNVSDTDDSIDENPSESEAKEAGNPLGDEKGSSSNKSDGDSLENSEDSESAYFHFEKDDPVVKKTEDMEYFLEKHGHKLKNLDVRFAMQSWTVSYFEFIHYHIETMLEIYCGGGNVKNLSFYRFELSDGFVEKNPLLFKSLASCVVELPDTMELTGFVKSILNANKRKIGVSFHKIALSGIFGLLSNLASSQLEFFEAKRLTREGNFKYFKQFFGDAEVDNDFEESDTYSSTHWDADERSNSPMRSSNRGAYFYRYHHHRCLGFGEYSDSDSSHSCESDYPSLTSYEYVNDSSSSSDANVNIKEDSKDDGAEQDGHADPNNDKNLKNDDISMKTVESENRLKIEADGGNSEPGSDFYGFRKSECANINSTKLCGIDVNTNDDDTDADVSMISDEGDVGSAGIDITGSMMKVNLDTGNQAVSMECNKNDGSGEASEIKTKDDEPVNSNRHDSNAAITEAQMTNLPVNLTLKYLHLDRYGIIPKIADKFPNIEIINYCRIYSWHSIGQLVNLKQLGFVVYSDEADGFLDCMGELEKRNKLEMLDLTIRFVADAEFMWRFVFFLPGLDSVTELKLRVKPEFFLCLPKVAQNLHNLKSFRISSSFSIDSSELSVVNFIKRATNLVDYEFVANNEKYMERIGNQRNQPFAELIDKVRQIRQKQGNRPTLRFVISTKQEYFVNEKFHLK